MDDLNLGLIHMYVEKILGVVQAGDLEGAETELKNIRDILAKYLRS